MIVVPALEPANDAELGLPAVTFIVQSDGDFVPPSPLSTCLITVSVVSRVLVNVHFSASPPASVPAPTLIVVPLPDCAACPFFVQL